MPLPQSSIDLKKPERPGSEQPPALTQMSTENKGGKSQRMDCCSSVAVPTLDGSAPSAVGGGPSAHTEKEEGAPASILNGRASNNEAHQFDGLSAVRMQFGDRGVSEQGAEIIMASWKPGTEKQYSPHIKRWSQFCGRGNINPLTPSVADILNFFDPHFSQRCGL